MGRSSTVQSAGLLDDRIIMKKVKYSYEPHACELKRKSETWEDSNGFYDN